jgi:hypothetical protein
LPLADEAIPQGPCAKRSLAPSPVRFPPSG